MAEYERAREKCQVAHTDSNKSATAPGIDLVPDSVVRQRRSEAHAIQRVAGNATEPHGNSRGDKEQARREAKDDDERWNWSLSHVTMLALLGEE